MKKIFALSIIAIFLFASVAIAGEDILGQGGFPSNAHKIFRLVRYVPYQSVAAAGTTNHPALTADSVVVWDCISDDGVTVTMSVTSMDSAAAGVAVLAIATPEAGSHGNTAAQDIGKRNWGFIQTYGLCQADLSTGLTCSAGDAIGVAATYPGKFARFPNVANTPSGHGVIGFAYDDGTSGQTDVEIFLKGLD